MSSTVSFEVAYPQRSKRVKEIDADGSEQYVERATWEVLRDAEQALIKARAGGALK